LALDANLASAVYLELESLRIFCVASGEFADHLHFVGRVCARGPRSTSTLPLVAGKDFSHPLSVLVDYFSLSFEEEALPNGHVGKYC
jgi:hypothetical protein